MLVVAQAHKTAKLFRYEGAKIAGCALSQVAAKRHASYGYSASGCYHGGMKKYYSDA